MRFCFLDRVVELEPDNRVVVTKGVSYAEPYLADHFPGAPVLPGAMMVETAVEAGMWLLRQSRDFPAAALRVVEMRQAKFSRVVRPGDLLTVEVTVTERNPEAGTTGFRARGTCGDEKVFSVRYTLESAPVGWAGADAVCRAQREFWSVLNAGTGRA